MRSLKLWFRRRFSHCNRHASPSKSFFAYGTFFPWRKTPMPVRFFTCFAHPRRWIPNAPIGQRPRTTPASAHYTHKKLRFPAHATPKMQFLHQNPPIRQNLQHILHPTHRALCIRVGLPSTYGKPHCNFCIDNFSASTTHAYKALLGAR